MMALLCSPLSFCAALGVLLILVSNAVLASVWWSLSWAGRTVAIVVLVALCWPALELLLSALRAWE